MRREIFLALVELLMLSVGVLFAEPVPMQNLWQPASGETRAHARVATPTSSQLYQWSKPAAWHNAAVIVRAGSSCGSGVYVQHGAAKGVLTAAHVVRDGGQVSVEWRDGKRQPAAGQWVRDKHQADVAFIPITRDDAPCLAVATAEPERGAWLEVLGFGGPGSQLRHYFVQYAGATYQQDASANPGPMQGDSGGAILTRDNPPRVVSVVSAGSDSRGTLNTGQGGSFNAFGELIFARPQYVAAFLGRVSTQCGPGGCYPGGCGPGGCPPGPLSYGGGLDISQVYPPQSPGGGSVPFRLYPIPETPPATVYRRAPLLTLLHRIAHAETSAPRWILLRPNSPNSAPGYWEWRPPQASPNSTGGSPSYAPNSSSLPPISPL